MKASGVDPITLTVIWNSLISIADELGVTLAAHGLLGRRARRRRLLHGHLRPQRRHDRAGQLQPGASGLHASGGQDRAAILSCRHAEARRLDPGQRQLHRRRPFPDTYEIMPVFLEQQRDRLRRLLGAPGRYGRCGAGLAEGAWGYRGVPGGIAHPAGALRARGQDRRGHPAHRAWQRAHARQGARRSSGPAHGQSDRVRAPGQDVQHYGSETVERAYDGHPRSLRGDDAGGSGGGAGRHLQLRGPPRRLRSRHAADPHGGRHHVRRQGRGRVRLLAVVGHRARRAQLLHQLHARLRRVRHQGILQCPRPADRGQHAADQAQGARRLLLQSQDSPLLRADGRSCRSAFSTP